MWNVDGDHNLGAIVHRGGRSHVEFPVDFGVAVHQELECHWLLNLCTSTEKEASPTAQSCRKRFHFASPEGKDGLFAGEVTTGRRRQKTLGAISPAQE